MFCLRRLATWCAGLTRTCPRAVRRFRPRAGVCTIRRPMFFSPFLRSALHVIFAGDLLLSPPMRSLRRLATCCRGLARGCPRNCTAPPRCCVQFPSPVLRALDARWGCCSRPAGCWQLGLGALLAFLHSQSARVVVFVFNSCPPFICSTCGC